MQKRKKPWTLNKDCGRFKMCSECREKMKNKARRRKNTNKKDIVDSLIKETDINELGEYDGNSNVIGEINNGF
jgi:hypothetical protein